MEVEVGEWKLLSLPCYPAESGIGCGGREIALATRLPGRKGDRVWGKGNCSHYPATRRKGG